MNWSELSAELQTGDIILFHQDGLISKLIELFTEAHFSHVGMVVREEDGSLHLWQSFEPEGGVVMDALPGFLEKYAKDYKGVYFDARRLQMDRSPDLWDALPAFVEEMNGRPFPTLWGMIKHFVEGKLGIDSGEKTFFCSDLIADTFMRVGLLAKKPPPNFYAPKNFSTSKDLHLLLGATYSDRINIELAPKS